MVGLLNDSLCRVRCKHPVGGVQHRLLYLQPNKPLLVQGWKSLCLAFLSQCVGPRSGAQWYGHCRYILWPAVQSISSLQWLALIGFGLDFSLTWQQGDTWSIIVLRPGCMFLGLPSWSCSFTFFLLSLFATVTAAVVGCSACVYGILGGFWLWSESSVVLGPVASIVSQVTSNTDLMNPVRSTAVSWNAPQTTSCSADCRAAFDWPDYLLTSRITVGIFTEFDLSKTAVWSLSQNAGSKSSL